MRTVLALMIGCLLISSGCAASLRGKWDGSGEIGEARFFAFKVDFKSSVPCARFEYSGGQVVKTAICDLVTRDGNVTFRMDPSRSIEDCATMVTPLTFVGIYGLDVLTGNVFDRSSPGQDRLVGIFRAFRERTP